LIEGGVFSFDDRRALSRAMQQNRTSVAEVPPEMRSCRCKQKRRWPAGRAFL